MSISVTRFLESNETVVTVARRHWMNVFPAAGSMLVMAGLCIYAFYLLGRYGDTVSQVGPVKFAAIGLGCVLALMLLLAYISYFIYVRNFLIITDKGVILVARNGLFNSSVTRLGLDRLQGASGSQEGFLANAFGYGDMTVETEGDAEDENFQFTYARNPETLAAQIMDLHAKFKG